MFDRVSDRYKHTKCTLMAHEYTFKDKERNLKVVKGLLNLVQLLSKCFHNPCVDNQGGDDCGLNRSDWIWVLL